MNHRDEIRFILNDRGIALRDVAPGDTLLDFLRLNRRLTGTKEGCAEGDCGACTVLVGRLGPEGLIYESVTSCIRFLASLDGCHVVTIEHLRGSDGGLHPVQQAMVAHHGSQCGFCTPGIVMSLYALWMETPRPTVDQVEVALQGNLCRCTGYAPIIRAAMNVGAGPDPLAEEREGMAARLRALQDGARVHVARGGATACLPADLDDFAALYEAMPEATIIAGATDVGLWVTKHLADLRSALFIGHIGGLKGINHGPKALTLGAGVTYSEAMPAIARAFAHLAPYWQRIGGWQVRNMGTVGGNIANGSPIGDTAPAFIALGAELTLRRGAVRRVMPLEDFFITYGKQDRAPGEFVERIRIPYGQPGTRHAAYKLSKRRDEDISSVALGLMVREEAGRIRDARLAFGGMAGTPARAKMAEAALIGAPWSAATFEAAAGALASDFTPMSDQRASAEYRMRAAGNLLRRFWLEEGEGVSAQLPPLSPSALGEPA